MELESVTSYAELKMKLELMGATSLPSEALFDAAMAVRRDNDLLGFVADRRWRNFCEAIRRRLRFGSELSSMNAFNSGLM